jgi:quercetin dioxygenase-like cupin family protein
MDLFIIPIRIYSGFMKHRRQFLQTGLASLALVVLDRSEAPAASGIKAIYERELPAISLNGWQVTVLELIFPPGTASPKHAHPGFILGYILEGEYRFQLEGEQEKMLSTGDVFYEAPGSTHLRSGNTSITRPARILVLAFAEKGKEITELL